MNDLAPSPASQKACEDFAFRLAIYEAGHALTARALGLKVLAVKMLPRPPILESDKVLRGNSLRALQEVLENRCIELFGGQIAEDYICRSSTAFAGDVARIDELTRLISGLEGKRSPEEVWFELEDVAIEILNDQRVRDAIVPVAEFLHDEVEQGHNVIPGEKVEALMDDLLGAPEKPKGGFLGRFMSRG